MLDEFYYENHIGKKVYFGNSSGVFANYNDLRDYEWTYTSTDYSVSSFKRTVKEKTIPIVFCPVDGTDVKTLRDDVFEIFENDTLSEQDGKIYINGFYMSCRIVSSSNTEFLESGKYLKTDFKIVCTDSTWHKVTSYVFEKQSTQSGIDFPLDFSFDLGFGNDSNRKIITNDCIVSCPFVLTIEGECEDPSIEIAGHTYKVNGTLSSAEELVITSDENKGVRSILKNGKEDRSSTNWFSHRYKEQSIFEQIPAGNIAVSWTGNFTFKLDLIDSRSEPKWS